MKKLFVLFFALLLSLAGVAQIKTYPYDYNQYQRINSRVYSLGTKLHTALKPIQLNDTTSLHLLDSLTYLNIDTTKKRTWLARKLFMEHLVEIKNKDYNVYMDFLPDFQIGRDVEHYRGTWLNTRGYQIQGNIGSRFSFYTSGYENQAVLPEYLTSFIRKNGIIPGLVNDKFGAGRNTTDWAWASALINYTPNKYFSFTFGQDKNFIGDGYRSMLLSDVVANYPFFKIVTTLGNVQYTNIWAQLQDLTAPKLSYQNGFRKKWAVFHYLDWNVSNRVSLGFFESIVWQDADEYGKRGFDVSYLNPVIFYRTIEGYNGSPDNALIGFNGKYKFAKNLTLYGQFLLDEFTAKEFFGGRGYWANKYGVQAGIKGFDAFKIKNLNFLAEFNTARPYTYSEQTSLTNYGHYNQPLAHPYGANFREFLTIWNYNRNRWQLSLQGNIARYGLDTGTVNYGKDIFKSYNTRISKYGNSTGQGLGTSFTYLNPKISYLLNPKNNLRIELGCVYRHEKNDLADDKTTWITFGLRSSFRNIYQDF